jgi:hypothetical protein
MSFYSQHFQLPADSAITVWSQNLVSGIQAIGMEPFPASNLERWMRGTGFTNVHNTNKPLPLGPWPKDRRLVGRIILPIRLLTRLQKEVGAYNLMQFLDGLESFTLRIFVSVHQWSVDEVRVNCAQVKQDACNMKLRLQCD